MHTLQLSGHISESVAQDYIFSAARGNEAFENKTVCGWDVEFIAACGGEYIARVVSCNQARTVVAVAFVDKFDN